MAGGLPAGGQGQDPLRLQLRDGGELHQGLPVHAEPRRHPRHQPQQPGDCGGGLCRPALRQEDQIQGSNLPGDLSFDHCITTLKKSI